MILLADTEGAFIKVTRRNSVVGIRKTGLKITHQSITSAIIFQKKRL